VTTNGNSITKGFAPAGVSPNTAKSKAGLDGGRRPVPKTQATDSMGRPALAWARTPGGQEETRCSAADPTRAPAVGQAYTKGVLRYRRDVSGSCGRDRCPSPTDARRSHPDYVPRQAAVANEPARIYPAAPTPKRAAPQPYRETGGRAANENGRWHTPRRCAVAAAETMVILVGPSSCRRCRPVAVPISDLREALAIHGRLWPPPLAAVLAAGHGKITRRGPASVRTLQAPETAKRYGRANEVHLHMNQSAHEDVMTDITTPAEPSGLRKAE